MSNIGARLFIGGTNNPATPFSRAPVLSGASYFSVSTATNNPDGSPLGVPSTPAYVYTFVPTTANAAGYAALQTTAGAANLTLTAGTGVTAVSLPTGQTMYRINDTADVYYVARNVTLTSAGNISAVTVTITGFDAYGRTVVQTLAGPNANTVSTTKTFVAVLSVAVSAAVGTNTSVGFGDVFGLPFVANYRGAITPKWDTMAAEDAGTFVAAVVTSPATAVTGDVRGTYTPSTASNGTRRLFLIEWIPDANLQTFSAIYGVSQFGG